MNATSGTCRGCGKTVLWIVNENGKNEPFDWRPARVIHVPAPPNPNDAPDFQVFRAHLPHFVTCPKAADFKRK